VKKNLLLFSFLIAGFSIVPAFCFAEITLNPTETSAEDVSISIDPLGHFIRIYVPGNPNATTCLPGGGADADFGPVYGPTSAQTELTIANWPEAVKFHGEYLGTYAVLECAGSYDFRDEKDFEVISPPPSGPTPIFTLPAGAVATTTNVIGDLVNAIFPFIALFIGVPLAFYVITRIIKIVPKDKDAKEFKKKIEDREEKEFRKVSKLVKERKADEVGEWLEDWRKGKKKF